MKRLRQLLKAAGSMKAGLLLLALSTVFLVIGTILFPNSYTDNHLFRALFIILLLNMLCCCVQQLLAILSSLLHLRRCSLYAVTLLLIHAGIVISLIGGAIGSVYGFKAKFALFEGDQADLSPLSRNMLRDTLRLDAFLLDLNEEDGSLSQYTADFSLLSAGQTSSISINHPARIGGFKLYISESIDCIDIETISLSGLTSEAILGKGEILELSGSDIRIRIERYVPDYQPDTWRSSKSMRKANETVVYTALTPQGAETLTAAPIGKWIRATPENYVRFVRQRPYVVFMLKYDPGLVPAAIGSVLLMIGVCLLQTNRRKYP